MSLYPRHTCSRGIDPFVLRFTSRLAAGIALGTLVFSCRAATKSAEVGPERASAPALAAPSGAAPAADEPTSFQPASTTALATSEPTRVYFGNLHAHSRLSDGNPDISPGEAYRIAREEGGLDFLSLSEHNHMLSTTEMRTLRDAAEQATVPGFVALFGQEYSTIKHGGNHANIQNYPLVIPAALNGKYGKVFGSLLPDFCADHPDTVVFAEFNHPRSSIQSDYGLDSDFDGDFGAFVAAMDPFVKLIAIANGPADADNKSFMPSPSQRLMHRDIGTGGGSEGNVRRWFDYLAHGMHLAPKIDHDTHSPTYGFRVAARTAVWVQGELDRDKLLSALASRHVYATEEPNLRIIPAIAGGYLPGDVARPASEGTLAVTLRIDDEDEPGAEYTVEVYSGIAGSGSNAVTIPSLTTRRSGNGTLSIGLPTEHDVSSYFVLHIEQRSTDPLSRCGSDDAWLAPIWIEWSTDDVDDAPEAQFMGSKRSNLYHLPDCTVVGMIKPENLAYYSTPPPGKRLHTGCPTD